MRYQNPASTVDMIVKKENQILLVKRKGEPFKEMWALPGGFLDYGKENLEQAAARELKEETGLLCKKLRLFNVYSSPERDPRGHAITHVYIIDKYTGKPKAGDDAQELLFFSIYGLPPLAFDHEKIIKDYLNRNKK